MTWKWRAWVSLDEGGEEEGHTLSPARDCSRQGSMDERPQPQSWGVKS